MPGLRLTKLQARRFGLPLIHRCELIAPPDNMMWDRSLIKVLFDFDCKW